MTNNVHAWNGHVVTVDGWLAKCGRYDCAIYPSEKDALNHANAAIPLDAYNGLSIGSPLNFKEAPRDFDQRAAPLQFKRVLLKARINHRCFPHGCKDRADILQPIDIKSWNPLPAGSPEVEK